MRDEIKIFFEKQLVDWQLAQQNYNLLRKVKVKNIRIGSTDFKIQFNPKRIISSTAKVDRKSIQERACFLCSTNRPKEQISLSFKNNYQILVNPFPIFPLHFTISEKRHTPQKIENRMEDMLDLADLLEEYVVFYNGEKCGASAPDHFHFQAGNKGFLPLQTDFKSFIPADRNNDDIIPLTFPCHSFAFRSTDKKNIIIGFEKITKALKELKINKKDLSNDEPLMNLLCWKECDRWILVIIPREVHRPKVYFAEGDKNIMISPASVDLGGVFITARESDFQKIDARILETIISEVCLNKDDFSEVLNFYLQNK